MKTPNLFSERKQKLSASEIDFFHKKIQNPNTQSSFDFLIHSLETKHGVKCPHCGSEKVMKNGKMKNKAPRFLCNSCKKGYSLYTGTYLQYIKKKNKFFEYIPIRMSEGGSLRMCSKILGISLDTSFEWNKKVFGSLQENIPEGMEGILELIIIEDKTSRKGEKPEGFYNFQPYNPNTEQNKRYQKTPKLVIPEKKSEKVQIALSFSRNGDFDLKVIQLGDLERGELKQNLYSKIKRCKKILIEDSPIVKLFLQERKLSYYICEDHQKKKFRTQYYDVQTARALYKKFAAWMERFVGVATKYLQNYMKWFMVMMNYRNYDLLPYHLALNGLQNKKGKEGYKESLMFTN